MIVFDLDGTLIKCNSSLAFSKFLFVKGFFSFKQKFYCLYLKIAYRYFQAFSLETLHHKIFDHLFRGRNRRDIEKLVTLFLPTLLPGELYPPAIKRLKTASEPCLLLSSSPSFLVRPIAAYLGIPCFSTEYAIDKAGNFCHISKLMTGKEKAHIIQGCCEITAYSDSIDDLPLVEMATTFIGVSPCRRLRKLCRRTGREVI